MKTAADLAMIWVVCAMVLVIAGIVQDTSEQMTPYILFAVGASVFLVGADKIVKAIEKK